MFGSSSGSTNGDLVPIWLTIGIVFALFVGAGAGTLAWIGGDKVPAAIIKGGGAFVATITVVILIIGLLSK